MRALVVYCHPKPDSFTAAVRDVVLERLRAHGAELRMTDLYARGFDPVLSAADWDGYLTSPENRRAVAEDVADLGWADTLIFVYPTWWYAMPALLKGWLDRVFLPEVAFHLPQTEGHSIRPGLTQITRLAVFTSGGASRGLTWLVGHPGKRLLLRGIGLLCAPRCRKVFAAQYRMDRSTPASRARHLARVAARMNRLLR